MNVALALAGMGLQEMLVDDAFAPALAGMVLPEMPPELWALGLGFTYQHDKVLVVEDDASDVGGANKGQMIG